MNKSRNPLANITRQHLEGEAFFADFTPVGAKIIAPPPVSAPDPLPTTSPPPGPVDSYAPLIETIRSCRKCGLGAIRTHAVPGEGDTQARLMFVGEAPGADEDAQGRPFVGVAGQLLDKIINACGLQREAVYIANTLKCRPPGNRDPLPDEIQCCLPYLRQQIELINPEIIVALGAHAARTLTGIEDSIGRLRGRFHPCTVAPPGHPVRVMPTYHPAYLLRNYSQDNRRRVWEDIKKVMAELGLPMPG